MFTRYMPAALALTIATLVSAHPALARGDGGGGGGDRGNQSGGFAGDRGGFGFDPPRTDADRDLADRARRECNGPQYPDGATPRINYDADSFTCFEPGSTRR